MSYSLYVPLRRIPQHIEEVREIVQTFLSCNEETLIKYHFDNKPKAIISNVVHIKYKNEDCFLYFYDSVYEITGSKEFDCGLEIIAMSSKVSLPTVLAYSFCDEDYIIFNDDGLLGGVKNSLNRNFTIRFRDFFKRGLNIIQQYYYWQDEEELLINMPMNLEGFVGIGYCLSRVILYDFDFVYRYVNDEIKTITPKSTSIHEIKKMLPVWEKNYLETGSVFGKK